MSDFSATEPKEISPKPSATHPNSREHGGEHGKASAQPRTTPVSGKRKRVTVTVKIGPTRGSDSDDDDDEP